MKQEEIARLKKNKKEFDRLKDQLEHIGDWYQCLSCGWTSVYERKPDGNRENKCPECHKNNMENMQGTEMEYWENYRKIGELNK